MVRVLERRMGGLGSLTPSREQACISRQARGGVWGVLTCLCARLPLFAVGPPFLKENNCFPSGNDATARIVSRRARGPRLTVAKGHGAVWRYR